MKKKTIISIIIIAVILLLVQIYIDNNILESTIYEIEIENLPKEFEEYKIVQLTDLHSREYGKNNSYLIKNIKLLNPDIIVMTGDMLNSKDTNLSKITMLAQNLTENYEVYYVVGNHELDMKKSVLEELITNLKTAGVKVLDNEHVVLTKNGQTINIYGLWYNLKYYGDEILTKETIEKIIGKDEDDIIDIMLTHNPNHIDLYNQWGAELVMCGHIHGGMVRLPFAGGVFSPGRTLFPKYDSGVYKINNTSMVLSRGLGIGNTGFRLFNRPEICEIILKSK